MMIKFISKLTQKILHTYW